MSRHTTWLIPALVACLPTLAQAHHAFATEFDGSLEGAVEGIVTKVWWTNPHIRYDVDVTLAGSSRCA